MTFAMIQSFQVNSGPLWNKADAGLRFLAGFQVVSQLGIAVTKRDNQLSFLTGASGLGESKGVLRSDMEGKDNILWPVLYKQQIIWRLCPL